MAESVSTNVVAAEKREGKGKGRFPRGRRAGENDETAGDHPVR